MRLAERGCGLGSLGSGSLLSLLSAALVLLGGVHLGRRMWVLFLGLVDLNEIGHDLLLLSDLDLGALHDFDLETKHALAELDGTRSRIDEIVFGLTCGDLITLGVLLSLCTLSTDLTGNNDLATDGHTTAHDGTKDVVGGHTDGSAGQELVLEGLNVGGGAKVSVVRNGFDGQVDLVVGVVEVVPLLDERLDLLDLTGLLGEEILALGGTDADLSVDTGGANLNTGVALHTESLLEELVELSLENTVSNELLLRVNLLGSS